MTSPDAFITVSYTIGSMALPQHEVGLRHYLDTILRTDERQMILHLFQEGDQSDVYYMIYFM